MIESTRPPRRWENQTVSLEHDARRTLGLWKMLLGITLATMPFGFWLLQQNEYARLAYRTSELRVEHERIVEETRRLRQRRTAGEALHQIERWALEERGLIRPAAERVVIVRPAADPARDLMARAPGAQGTSR